MAIHSRDIPNDFHIKFDLAKIPYHLTEFQASEVKRIWEEQQKSRLLFDGLLFSVIHVEENCLIGKWVDYKYMIAQRYSPVLKSVLNVVPLGISAITTCGDSVLLGKRADFLANYPGCYECAPSGGVDPSTVNGNEVDLLALILKELEEEVGIDKNFISSIKLINLIYDSEAHSYELVATIELKEEALSLAAASEEYPEVFWVKQSEISAFLNLHKDAILPLSQMLLRRKLSEVKL